ncbi:MAG: isoprenyl transferase [Alphaproteobacteria bacterium]|nr:isoprenyl transferase [Alphaproteobacteria bacterium]
MPAPTSITDVENVPLPRHVAIIMDGNGRWARARGLPRIAGHRRGAEAAKEAIRFCASRNIPYLTIYAFSSENWKRPDTEVSELMQLLSFYLGEQVKDLHREGVCLRIIGDRSRLGATIAQKIEEAEALTRGNTRLHLNVALSYGGRQEIGGAVRQLAERVRNGEIAPEQITEATIHDALYTADIPDPDLLIRTGGEQRISNFLLWQMAYTELYFTDTLWPDFTSAHFTYALQEYQQRERRYGSIREHAAGEAAA